MKIALIGSRGFIAAALTKIWTGEQLYLFNRSPQKGEFFFDLTKLSDIDFSLFGDIDVAIFLAAIRLSSNASRIQNLPIT